MVDVSVTVAKPIAVRMIEVMVHRRIAELMVPGGIGRQAALNIVIGGPCAIAPAPLPGVAVSIVATVVLGRRHHGRQWPRIRQTTAAETPQKKGKCEGTHNCRISYLHRLLGRPGRIERNPVGSHRGQKCCTRGPTARNRIVYRWLQPMKQTLTRFLLTLPVVWLVVSLVFILIHLVPGDPILQMLGEGATPADIGALRHQYGLDQSLWHQYVHYWAGVVHGNLGLSIRLHDSVLHLIAQRYPYTIALTFCSLALAIALAVPAGILAALKRGRLTDQALSVVSLFGLSVPAVALGPVLILLFSIMLGWTPVSGASPSGGGAIDWRYLILPSVTMGLSLAAILTRMVRTALLEELGQDYIRTARAKGLSETAVLWRHALPNALVPIITVIGLQFGALLAGAIVTEKIFSWPGIGRLTIDAISNRDYALVQGCLLAIGLTYVLVNFFTDVVFQWINPRMRG